MPRSGGVFPLFFGGIGIDKRGLGLFGMIGVKGRLKNMVYEPGGPASVNCNISKIEGKPTTLCAGGLAGSNFKGTIENCSVLGFKVSTCRDFIAVPEPDRIANFYVGSLVGLNQYGTISNCFAQVWNLDVQSAESVNADNFAVGALAGCSYGKENVAKALVENCFAVGTISGGVGAKLSGLVGQNGGYGKEDCCTIKNSYSAVTLRGSSTEGASICHPRNTAVTAPAKGKVENCYYLSDIWDSTPVDKIVYNITPQTYDQLRELTITGTDGTPVMGSLTSSAEAYPYPVSTKDTKDKEKAWHYFGGPNWPKPPQN